MNGKQARALRKALKYSNKRDEREYHTFLVNGTDNVMQYDSITGEVDTVYRTVEKETIECVSGGRKLYKYYKRKFNDPTFEVQMNTFPSEQEIKDLTDTIKSDIKESGKPENRKALTSSDKENGE